MGVFALGVALIIKSDHFPNNVMDKQNFCCGERT
jgi:hypothetical protein